MVGIAGEQPADLYRVIVADDAAGMRELMRTLLSLEPDFEVVGQAGDDCVTPEEQSEAQHTVGGGEHDRVQRP